MKKHSFTLKEVLNRVIDDQGMRQKMMETDVKQNWEKIVGKMIASQTLGLFFQEGKLTIQISSATLKNELKYSRNKIIEIINTHAGFELIDDILIR